MIKNTSGNNELSFLACIYSVFLCIIFGANAVAIKISLCGLGVFTTAGLRFTIASIAICLWAKTSGLSFNIKKGQIYQLFVIGIIFTVQLSLFYLGLSKTNASRGTLVVNILPFFVLFLAHFFLAGDRITIRKIIGMVIGFAGVAFVFFEEDVTANFQSGDLIILAAAFLWACNIIYVKRIINSFKAFHIVIYPMIFSVPLFFIEGFLWDASMIAYIDLKIVGSMLYQSIVTAAFGFMAWNMMLQKYGATALHSFVFIMPIAGVTLGGIVLNEPLTFNIIIALLLVVSGIIVINFKKRISLFPIGRWL
ncbi:MAG: DMT family transporter [Desulfobacteraceae bacterium]|nr:DMT family transporter [Desulfobacteraceae bacterium]MBC2718714.1 DMT family transporter [Desulfobacteraceae bacterium]